MSLSTALRILVGIAVIVALAVFVAIGPWRGGTTKPVIHAVIQRPELQQSGAVRNLVVQREEYWYDTERNLLHFKSFVDGKLVSQGLKQANPNGQAILSPALDVFLNGYKQALTNGLAHETGTGMLDGKRVLWVTLPDGSSRQRVAVDAVTYDPLEIQQLASNGKPNPNAWQVRTIELLPRRATDFVTP